MKVFKIPLRITDEQTISSHEGFEILTVQVQNDVPCLWVKVDENVESTQTKTIYTHGTGHKMNPNAGRYIGTYQFYEGKLVCHVFEGV